MSFSEEQVAFRDNVRRMVARHVAPIAAEIDETDRFPLELVKLFGEMGLMQLWVPERYDGPNGNLTMACIAREEISKVSPACASIAALNTMFIMPLLHFGSEEQRRRYLPIIAKGGVVTAIAISEPQAGSDVAALNTRARRDGDSYILNGRKQWCSYGVVADYIVVMARTSDGAGADGISAFIVERGMKGFRTAQKLDKLGMRGSDTCELVFEDCEVPEENVLGPVGKGVNVLMSGLDYERAVLAAGPVGIMQAALDVVVPYVHERKQFDTPIGEFQLVQAMLADMQTGVMAGRALVRDAAQMWVSGTDRRIAPSAAKLFCTEMVGKVADLAVQVHGGSGYMRDVPVERIYRDVRLLRLYEGTSEIQRLVIARNETGLR